jgi:hypothetical protein
MELPTVYVEPLRGWLLSSAPSGMLHYAPLNSRIIRNPQLPIRNQSPNFQFPNLQSHAL